MKRTVWRSALFLLTALVASKAPHAVSPDIVISQVYGGGGNSGATFTHDFIELYNRGSLPVDLSGWTVQYASAAGTSWQTTALSGTMHAGRYYLVQQAAGAGGTTALPAPDTIGTLAMSASSGKVALVRSRTALAGACPIAPEVADLVGYGAAGCSETAPTPALSSSTAALRSAGGAADTDSNLADFAIGVPNPRHAGTLTAALTGAGAAVPAAITSGEPTLLTVAVSPASGPSSTGITVRADLSAIGGNSMEALEDSGTAGDVTAGDKLFSVIVTPSSAASGILSLPVLIADAEGRTSTAAISLTIVAPPARVVISQVYGGGGNSGAELRNDFIELRNLEPFDVNVAGWSVQYSSPTAASWTATVLNGIIPAHGYYLVQEAAGTGGLVSLPTPDAIGTLALAAANGKVALVAGPMLLSASCPTDQVLDIVGYGAANCFEGAGPAPALSNTLAALRLEGGLVDTNDNAADFAGGTPAPRSTLGLPPTGLGAAAPASLPDGATTLLTITASPGTFPPAPLAEVRVDLSPIGGSGENLFDDGTRGDVQAGDGIYSRQVVVSGAPGFAVLTGSLHDARGRSSTTQIRLAIETTTAAIADIQGSGSMSPLEGQFVTVAGVVTALRRGGFYVQTPDGQNDLDGGTSEGIFVFGGPTPRPSVGDAVRVSGVVAEFAPAPPNPSVTEIAGRPVFTVTGSGLPLPQPVRLRPEDTPPHGPLEQLERFEGMRVLADLSVTAPTDGTVFESRALAASNGEFYAVILGLARPMREPGLDRGSALFPVLPCCVPRFDGNPERLRVDSDEQPGSARLEVAAGQRVLGITGVLDFAFGSYTLLPDPGAGNVAGPQQATPIPQPTAGEFTVASANLERFFDEQDDPERDDPLLTPEAVDRRLQKASLLVRQVLLSPDVLAVTEVENLAVLQRLAARINADAVDDGEVDPMYAAYLEEGNDIGGIDSGFLVKTARVDVAGVEQIGKGATYSPPGLAPGDPLPLLHDRPPLVLVAGVRGDGPTPLPVTVIVNHLRSLSGIEGADGERIRAKRRAQAEFVATLVQSRQGTERVIAVGDYNAFPFNDGIVDVLGTIKGRPASPDQVLLASADLVTPDLTNLGDALGPAEQYSFVFQGNAQALDHILVNTLALKLVTRAVYARSNADFPESLRGNPSRPERLSDHDAIVAYFAFPDAPAITLRGASEMQVEAYTTFEDPGATAHDGHAPLRVMTTGLVDVNTPGDYGLTYSASSGDRTTTVARVVRVRDTVAPRIVDFRVTPDILTPPNHRLVDVTASYRVTDASNQGSCALAVASSEPANGRGDGNTGIDWVVLDAEHLRLRAERSRRGRGRTYWVLVTCHDRTGNSAQAAAPVRVPR